MEDKFNHQSLQFRSINEKAISDNEDLKSEIKKLKNDL